MDTIRLGSKRMNIIELFYIPKNRIRDEVSEIQQEIDSEHGRHVVCDEPRDCYRKLSDVPAWRWNF
jgi:hypothetical protein